MSDVAAVILAAGLSSRMGAFKPLLEIDGRSMARRVTDAMLRAGAAPVVVVTGHEAARLRAHLSGRGVIFVHNERYAETQMLDSILLGLAALPETVRRVLVTPVDIPLIRPETLRALLGTEGVFVRPVFAGKGGHPIVLSRGLLPMLRQYRGTGGLRGALAENGVVPVDVAVTDAGVTMDADTPADYDRLLRCRRQQTGGDKSETEDNP